MEISKSTLSWLLENDNPSIRYVTLLNLVRPKPTQSELEFARKDAYINGAIGKILNKMKPEGYWSKDGPGYSPKYRSTVWSIIALSQLGAKTNDDKRIEKACRYYLDHAYSSGGYLGHDGRPSGVIDCLQGNMCAALTALGYSDPRLDEAYDWLVRSTTGEGVEKYYSHKCGPLFRCGANGKLPCAWGAVKVMLALSKIPKNKRTPHMKKAIDMGVSFLLDNDPATANYPTSFKTKPNSSWFKLGFLMFYITDVLQIVEVMVALGYGNDKRLKNVIKLITDKQDNQGRWPLEYEYNDKSYLNVGKKREPSKWVTYRVLNALQEYKNI